MGLKMHLSEEAMARVIGQNPQARAMLFALHDSKRVHVSEYVRQYPAARPTETLGIFASWGLLQLEQRGGSPLLLAWLNEEGVRVATQVAANYLIASRCAFEILGVLVRMRVAGGAGRATEVQLRTRRLTSCPLTSTLRALAARNLVYWEMRANSRGALDHYWRLNDSFARQAHEAAAGVRAAKNRRRANERAVLECLFRLNHAGSAGRIN